MNTIAIFSLALMIPALAQAQTLNMLDPPVYFKSFTVNESKSDYNLPSLVFGSEKNSSAAVRIAKKSPLKAAVLSAIVPGAGQWYAGSKKKAIAFFAAELSLWAGIKKYNDKGNDIKHEFRAYADQYWNEADYYTWWRTVCPDTSRYSHSLPPVRTQQYYEMIGKYDQFLAGWPDSDGSVQSDMRLFYMDRQHESNKMFKRSDIFASSLVINRVISAADAVLSVRGKASKLNAFFRCKETPRDDALMPVLYVRYIW